MVVLGLSIIFFSFFVGLMYIFQHLIPVNVKYLLHDLWWGKCHLKKKSLSLNYKRCKCGLTGGKKKVTLNNEV